MIPMEILTLIASCGGVLTALGIKEIVMWLLKWKSNKRIADADADKAELKNDVDEFHLLRERLEVADKHNLEKEKQIYDKEQRFHEQTLLVRDLNRQLIDAAKEKGELLARVSALEAERAMKLCERKGCVQRQPQSGY